METTIAQMGSASNQCNSQSIFVYLRSILAIALWALCSETLVLKTKLTGDSK